MIELDKDCIVSLDVGYKTTGVAITSNDSCYILPLGKIELKRFSGRLWFDKLRLLLKPYWTKIKVIVIGDPVSLLPHQFNQIDKYIEQVFRILSAQTNFQVMFFSERYSTQWASDMMRRINYSKQSIEKNINQMAAAKILKDFLFAKLLVDYQICFIR